MNQIQGILQGAITQGLSRLDAEVLLAHSLAVNRVYLYSWPSQTLPLEDIERFNSLVIRRLQGEPIAYIVGEKEFWSLTLDVNPDVLIPRPETELLVELTLKLLPQTEEPLHILELGTGSGAIALALAAERPHWQIFATDISARALAVAQANAKKLSLKNIHFYLGNWFEALTSPVAEMASPPAVFHAIVSNPPYIAEQDKHLQSRELQFEPLLALQSGLQGLQDLEKIITAAPAYLLSKAWLLLEHGFEQAEAVRGFFKAKNYIHIEHYKDLAAVNRVTVGQKP